MVRQHGEGYLKSVVSFDNLDRSDLNKIVEKLQREEVLPPEVTVCIKEKQNTCPFVFYDDRKERDYTRGFKLLIQPLSYLQPDEYSHLIDDKGWNWVLRRFELFEYLKQHSGCLFSLSELADFMESGRCKLATERKKLSPESTSFQRKVIRAGIEIFEILCEPLREGSPDNLLTKCSEVFVKVFSPKELCIGVFKESIIDICSHDLSRIVSLGSFSLSYFFEYIGHCEGELAVGVMAEMRKELRDLGKPGGLYLEHYSQVFGCPERRELDTTLNSLDDDLLFKKEDFDTDYRTRVNRAIEEKFIGNYDIMEPEVDGDTGTQFPENKEAEDKSSIVVQSKEDYAFRKSQGAWTIIYEGVSKPIKHVQGLFYIAFLLEHRGEWFRVTDLVERFQKNYSRPYVKDPEKTETLEGHSAEEYGAMGIQLTFSPAGSAKGEEIYNADSMKEIAEDYRRNEREGNDKECKEIIKHLARYSKKSKKYLSKILSDKPHLLSEELFKKIDDPNIKNYNNVSKCMRLAEDKIRKEIPSLADHFSIGKPRITSIPISKYCYSYQPKSPINWIVEY